MYIQQSTRFKEISELMLGIGLVEMRHFDKISDLPLWCPCCGKCYILSEEEVVNAIDNDLSVYAECSCGNSFYIETEDEQDNYSEW